jgi:hypothetical protein
MPIKTLFLNIVITVVLHSPLYLCMQCGLSTKLFHSCRSGSSTQASLQSSPWATIPFSWYVDVELVGLKTPCIPSASVWSECALDHLTCRHSSKRKLIYQLPCGDRVVCCAIRFCGWSCTCMCSSSGSPSWERWTGRRNGLEKNQFSSAEIQDASRLFGDLAVELNINLMYYWQITGGCLPWNSNLLCCISRQLLISIRFSLQDWNVDAAQLIIYKMWIWKELGKLLDHLCT